MKRLLATLVLSCTFLIATTASANATPISFGGDALSARDILAGVFFDRAASELVSEPATLTSGSSVLSGRIEGLVAEWPQIQAIDPGGMLIPDGQGEGPNVPQGPDPPQQVPEPITFTLLGIGVLALDMTRRLSSSRDSFLSDSRRGL